MSEKLEDYIIEVKETPALIEKDNDIKGTFDGRNTITFKRGNEIIVVWKIFQGQRADINLSEYIRIVDMA
jgi:hypothetical protein